MTDHIQAHYLRQTEELEDRLRQLQSAINKLSVVRLLVFAVALLLIWLFFESGWVAVSVVGSGAVVAFLFLVKKQLGRQEAYRFNEAKLLLLKNEMSVLQRGKNLYSDGKEFESSLHPYSSDLDLFGENSLFAYLNRCRTQAGAEILSAWLKSQDFSGIPERQVAAAELALCQEQLLDFRSRQWLVSSEEHRQALQFSGFPLSPKLQFLETRFLRYYLTAAPVITIVVFLAAVFLGGYWRNITGLALLSNAVVYFFYKKNIDYIHERVTRLQDLLKNYAKSLFWLENAVWESPLLLRRRQEVTTQQSIAQSLSVLSKIIRNLDYRLNIFVGSFLNLFFLWDFLCLKKLNRWQKRHFTQLTDALNWMSEFEALSSLATLDGNHPDWVYPQVRKDLSLVIKETGHPLIPVAERITNDFRLENHPTTDLITGSNMAGKSTFLRTLGINLVLAYAGAKVCASAFECGIFRLITYMRIKDSLAGKTSTFKAEIDRLKMIYEFSQSHPDALVLIDEMLRGTNSRDKYLGSKAFVEKLIAQNIHALVATHDLQLAELERQFPGQFRNFHFDISVDEHQEMFFDYKIKSGECKTFNASIMLKSIGLEI